MCWQKLYGQRVTKPLLQLISSLSGSVDSVLLGLDLALSPSVPTDVWESRLEADVHCQSKGAYKCTGPL